MFGPRPDVRTKSRLNSRLTIRSIPLLLITALVLFGSCSGTIPEQLFKAHEAKGAARSLQQALEQIRTCAALKAAQAPEACRVTGQPEITEVNSA